MLRRAFGRFVLAVVICGGLAGVVQAEQQAAPASANADVPYLYVFVVNSGPITWFIQIPLSIAVLALIIHYAILIRRKNVLPDETRDQFNQFFQAKQYREAMEFADGDVSMLGALVRSALHEAANGYGAMKRAVSDAAEDQSIRLMRKIEVLNIIGNISPMIGLFGTVTGMILAFWALVVIVQKGGVTDAAQLAAGIMYALGTTFWGLLVAIPALAAFSYFRGRIDNLTDETETMAVEMIEVFRHAARKQQSA